MILVKASAEVFQKASATDEDVIDSRFELVFVVVIFFF